MGKIVGYATVGMVLALAKKMAIQYGALGIADVRTTPDGSDLIFVMSDGSQHRVELNFSANGVDYNDSVTKFDVSNVQAAIEALFNELQSKQNTLTAGTGISIENDTISVTDAGGLTVLKESDFPLSADLLAKVNANPQNYCIEINSEMYYYYNNIGNTVLQYWSLPSSVVDGYRYMKISYRRVNSGDGSLSLGYSKYLLETDSTTIDAKSGHFLSVKAVRDTSDDSVKTGTEIRKAITIRKWH